MANYRVIGSEGREYGPVSPEQLRTWIGQGRVNASTLVCSEGSQEWRALGRVPEFSPFLTPWPSPSASGQTYQGVRSTNHWALWGFICGLLSLTFCSCCCLPFNILGVVFSVVGLVQISNNPQTQSGTTLAILGLVLSVLSLVLGFAYSALWVSSGAAEQFKHELHRGLNAGAGCILRLFSGMPHMS